jgi:hypothetical protein
MTPKKIIVAMALLLSATSATLAMGGATGRRQLRHVRLRSGPRDATLMAFSPISALQ